MAKSDVPKTQALRCLSKAAVPYETFAYRYEDRGGTAVSARELGVEEHAVIKTLIMETEAERPLIVLMHGDREVSTKQLARHLHVKSISPCTPKVANRHTGYQVGGTSPFGTRKTLPVYAEATLFELEHIYINAGKRGLLVRMNPRDLEKVLPVTLVQVAIDI